MLYHDAALSVLHFLFVFVLVGALSAEAFVLRLPVDARVAQLLTRIDAFYGLSALGLVVAGAARAVWGAKGWEYYTAQPFFWAKLGAFAILGVVSIWPTLAFLRWRKAAQAAPVSEADVKRVRRLVLIEVHMLALVLIFAALMARGIGS